MNHKKTSSHIASEQTNPVVQTALDYPFSHRWSPPIGEPFEVADGVFWLRVPLPIDLDHINLWLLKDGDGWMIVDSGYDADICKAAWEQVFTGFLSSESVNRILITHFHPDHIGLAAWLAHRCDCPIMISRGEFDYYHDIITRDKTAFAEQALTFAHEVGFDDKVAAQFAAFFGAEDKPDETRVQQEMCQFVGDGDNIEIDGSVWQVVTGNGHSPQHVCLYSNEQKVLISGDQSLPRISSNVSVYPSNRNENPLNDWLESCAKLRDNIAADTLILPSHQEPFYGIKIRMQQLIDEHQADLAKLLSSLGGEKNPTQACAVLFDRPLNPIQRVMATGETLAHLNYLLHQKSITVKYRGGVAYYQHC